MDGSGKIDLHKGVRSGAQYLAGLQDGREVWSGGERIDDVTTHPATRRGAATLGRFLDRQMDDDVRDTVTYVDEDGDRCAMAFMAPRSKDDVKARGRAYYEWATWSHGMFGRTPDYKNASLMSFATAKSWLDQGVERGMGQADFAANMQNYYDYVRKNDKVLTHTLVNPQKSHAVAKEGKYDDEVALHVVKETDAGIIVKGLACWRPWAHWRMKLRCFQALCCVGQRKTFRLPLPSRSPSTRRV